METSFFDALKPLMAEAYRRRLWIMVTFVAVNIVALVLGLSWPKVYESYATVFVQERNILGRMTETGGGQTGVEDRVRIAREVIYSRRLMSQVLEKTGQTTPQTDPKQLEQKVMDMQGRTTVSNVGGRNANLIKIAYRSGDPQQAFQAAQLLAQGFIAESSADKERDSQSAFQFVDSQVQEYENKLKRSEEQLKEFRARNEAVTPGAEADVRQTISRLRTQIASNEQLLREARIKERSLVNQLAGESDSAVSNSQLQLLQQRRAELQQRLDALRLNYLETYPDIITVKSQIEDLNTQIMSAESGGPGTGESGGSGSAPSTVALQLKSELYNTRTAIKTLVSRLEEFQSDLEDAQTDAKAIPDAEAQLAELTREYEVTKGIYEDLLRRREIARVSMNLDLEKQGLTLRIDEPAFYPYLPTGLRFWHFLLGGVLGGLLAPLGVIFALQMVRPKFRLLPHIPERTGLPVMGSVPHLPTPGEIRSSRVTDFASVSMLIMTFVMIALVAMLRYQGVI